MRHIITQHYTIEHQEMFNLTSPINKAFAEKNGFEYISNNVKRCSDRKIWWEKIAWIIELLDSLEDGSLVVYEDCDSINLSGDLKSALNNGEFGMVQLRGGLNNIELKPWFNAGVIFMLNTSDVRDFLKRIWLRNDETDETSINNELKALNKIIGNKQITSLGVEWNCWDNNKHLPDSVYIKSWHGMRYHEKLIAIQNYIKK